MTAPYSCATSASEPRPVSLPTRCLEWEAGEHCHLAVHHRRDRKTGPRCALTVLRCSTHGVAFTVYPEGFTPYLRRRVVPPASSPTDASEAEALPALTPTVFDAAEDASEGRRWLRSSTRGDTGWHEAVGDVSDGWSSTQERHVARALRLLGIEASQSLRERHLVAEVLGLVMLELLAHVGAMEAVARGQRRRERGRRVVAVLSALPRTELLVARLLFAGGVVGLWGQPHFVDGAGGLIEAPFRGGGSRAPPR